MVGRSFAGVASSLDGVDGLNFLDPVMPVFFSVSSLIRMKVGSICMCSLPRLIWRGAPDRYLLLFITRHNNCCVVNIYMGRCVNVTSVQQVKE